METDHEAGAGRGVLVTGCSSGIGRATALHLARCGFTVFATVRREADRAALEALGAPGLVPLCPLDLARPADIAPLVGRIEAELARRGQPGLYALVNNAGAGGVAPIELMDPDAFRTELDARLAGPVALIQAVLPLLRRASGRIVWIVTPALMPTAYVASIHACDFAANCLARTLDIELKPWGIPVIQVRCGGIKTAKGLETTAEAEAVLARPRGELYRTQVERWAHEMAAFDRQRTPPERVAEVVAAALSAARPKRRYRVGHMAAAAAFLEALPQPLADAILKARV
jgi:NAD(P)-dependent dehydrogenase (short-subunit alcohol dehydrogenase family)